MSIKCPCVDCITLAMCKSYMSEHYGLFHLQERCSIFRKRYGGGYFFVPDHPERIFLLKLFKPIGYEKRIIKAKIKESNGN